MQELREAVLYALVGSSSQRPLGMEQIAAELPAPKPAKGDLATCLAELAASRAVNTARISADGKSWRDVFWSTGLPPRLWRHTVEKPSARPSQESIMNTETVLLNQIRAAIAGLTEASAATAEEVFEKCPAAGSLGSVKASLRKLAGRGEINVRHGKARSRTRAFYWAKEAPSLQPEPAAGDDLET